MDGTGERAELKYRPELDGIRAFCILFTIFHHIPGHPSFCNGTVGVDVFFPLSGWLITEVLMRSKATNGTRVVAFYIRRIFRIVPLYVATLLLYWGAVSVMAAGSSKVTQFHNALPLLISFNREYGTAVSGNSFGHAWTLGIEEKFYFAWPLLFWLGSRHKVMAWIAGLTAIAGLFWLASDPSYLWRGYLGLGFGSALAVLSRRDDWRELLCQPVASNCAWLLMAIGYGLSTITGEGLFNILIAAGGSLLIGGLWYRPDHPATKLLSWPPLVFVGRLTYPVYLVHVLMMNLAIAVAARFHLAPAWYAYFAATYLLSVGVAFLANRTIEAPLIATGKRLAKRATERMGRERAGSLLPN